MPDQFTLLHFFARMQEEKQNRRYNGTLLQNAPMQEYCSFHIGGTAALLARPADIPSLCLLLREAYAAHIPVILLGMGSNVLLPDGVFGGILIITRDLRNIEINGTKATAECGASLNSLILRCAAADLGGLELLYGIPASVGGAAYMNAGAHGVSFGTSVLCLEAYDPRTDRIVTLSNEELAYAYRKSALQAQSTLAVTRLTLSLNPTPEDVIRARIREVVHRRALSQPLALPSAGSAFLRPCESLEVWRLVDACGLRGYRVGGAAVSEKHAGFIVNCGGATARDVRLLMDHIRAAVLARHGVTLIPEICIFE